MKRFLFVMMAVFMVSVVAADAWARAGRGGSMGSRGSRSADRPIERTITPPPAQAPGMASPSQPMTAPGAAARPGMNAPAPAAAGGSFMQRNPMMAGIMGGLLGVGIGSMLFGDNEAMAAAADENPGASMFGSILQIALIGGAIFLVVRMFRRRAAAANGAAPMHQGYERSAPAQSNYGMGGYTQPAGNRVEQEFQVSGEDQEQFASIITAVQKAWSDGNIFALRSIVTPEIMGWMNEDLAKDQSNNVRNVVEDVTLLRGDVVETWSEGNTEYATAQVTYSLRDYTIDLGTEQIVEGSKDDLQEATEAWTFVRQNGGRWLLSAIEK